ncbi:uncharacterized protein LOC133896632 isoform X2 [Phragmites australis]|uniref:uncharacterized protein LOC133896632 isoform X2 n=1 Tax=Phragmites australis TaxID=29695 RepID=UPI002D7871A6|nr:uncharacterized protein LOC133896632 isoform X2 [Phragmites australis]
MTLPEGSKDLRNKEKACRYDMKGKKVNSKTYSRRSQMKEKMNKSMEEGNLFAHATSRLIGTNRRSKKLEEKAKASGNREVQHSSEGGVRCGAAEAEGSTAATLQGGCLK